MIWGPVLAVSFGAAAGALLRWQLGAHMNSLFPILPLGTLAANLVGGYIIGVAIAYFAQAPNIAPEWRLLTITGYFLGRSPDNAPRRSVGLGHGRHCDPRHRIANDDPGRVRHRAIAEIPVRSKA